MKKLRETKYDFDVLFENNPAPMSITYEQKLIEINSAFLRTLGFTKDEVMGKTIEELGIMPDMKQYRQLYKTYTTTGQLKDVEIISKTKDGKIIYGLLSGETIEYQGKKCFLSVVVNISEIRELSQKVEAEKQRLQNVIESTNVGTWEWNVQTGEAVFNKRWADIIGYTLKELSPIDINTWVKFVHPDDLNKLNEVFFKHFEKETDFYEVESRMKHKNGNWVWVLDKGKVVEWSKDGQPVRMFGTHSDISNRKIAEEARAESEKRYNLALDSAQVGLWDWNLQTNHVYYSPMYKHILGYAVNEFENSIDSWKSRWHPEDAPKIEQAMEDYKLGKTKKFEIAHRLRHKSGEWRWIVARGAVLKNSSGTPYRWIGTISDTTDLMNVRESSEELEHIFAVNPDFICIVDKEANFVKLNQAWSEVLKYPLDELKQRKYLDFVHPDDLNETLAKMTELKTQNKPVNFVNRYRCCDGSYRYLEWRAHPYENLIYCAVRDISSKIENEKMLKSNLNMREKLIALMKLKGIPSDKFLHRALEEVISFTGSKIGYIFLYDQENEEFTLHSWSDSVLAECKVKDQSRLFYLGDVGLWGEVVRQRKPIIVNDYPSSTFTKKGYPQGHVPIANFISIPIFSNYKIVAVVGAANKDIDYDYEDVLNLSLLMSTVWPAIERIKAEEVLAKEREFLKTTLFSIEEGIIAADIKGKITLMNKMAEKYTGWSKEDAYGKDFSDIFHIVNIFTGKKGADPVMNVIETGISSNTAEYVRLISKDETEFFISGRASKIVSEDGSMTGVVVSFRNVTKEYQQEKEIEGFLNVNLDMLCVADKEGSIYKVNHKFEDVLGYKPGELQGKSFLSFVHKEDIPATLNVLHGLTEQKPIDGFVNRFLCKNGSYKYIEWHVQPSIGDYTYSSAKDVTEKQIKEEELWKFSVKDELTGLYNRYFFDTIITEEIERSDRYDEPLSIAIMDLDHFKAVNDTWGHQTGDELLKKIAGIITDTIRKSDILVRFGGEEFVVLMPQTSLENAMTVSEKVRAAIENVNNPTTGTQTISIGVAEKSRYESFRRWYRRVDGALYRAKESGRNQIALSDKQESLSVASIHLDWRREWESGNEEIDSQHKELIEIANHLIEMSLSDVEKPKTEQVLNQLLTHISHHIVCEENILSSIQYPDYRLHASLHESIIAKALRLKELYQNGELESFAFFSFVIDDVILGHILDADMKYFSYTRNVL